MMFPMRSNRRYCRTDLLCLEMRSAGISCSARFMIGFAGGLFSVQDRSLFMKMLGSAKYAIVINSKARSISTEPLIMTLLP